MRGFLSDQASAVGHESDVLELITELVDAHADTVQLLLDDDRTELETWAHCDYLRRLQRVGQEALAHHDPGRPDRRQTTRITGMATATFRRGANLLMRSPAAIFVRAAAPPMPPGARARLRIHDLR